MKKILTIMILFSFIFLLFSCKKKRVIKSLNDAIKYVEESKKNKTNLKIENETITGLIDVSKTDEHLILTGAKKVASSAVVNNPKIKTIIICEDVLEVSTSAIANLDQLEKIYFLGNKKLAFNSISFNKNLTQVSFYKTTLEAKNNPFIKNTNLETIELRDVNNIQFKNKQLLLLNDKDVKVLSILKGFNGIVDESATSLLTYAGGLNSFEFKELQFAHNSKIKTIEKFVFSNVSKLEKITLPKTLERIEPDFASLHGLKEIILEEGNPNYTLQNNTLIKDDTIILGSKNTKELTNKITKIGTAAFAGNTALLIDDIKNIISADIRIIGDHAFLGCTNLKGNLDLKDRTFTYLGKEIFKLVDINLFSVDVSANPKFNLDWNKR